VLAAEAPGSVFEPLPDPVEFFGDHAKPSVLPWLAVLAWNGKECGLLANQALDASEQLELGWCRRKILDLLTPPRVSLCPGSLARGTR
jgi:hypothetical protein